MKVKVQQTWPLDELNETDRVLQSLRAQSETGRKIPRSAYVRAAVRLANRDVQTKGLASAVIQEALSL